MKKQIIFFGNGPCLNRGCEAILRGTHKIIEQAFGKDDCLYKDFHVTQEKWLDTDSKDSAEITLPNLSMTQFPVGKAPKKYSAKWLRGYICRKVLGKKYHQEFSYELEDDLLRASKKSDAVLFLGGDNLTLDYGWPEHYVKLIKKIMDQGSKFIIWGASVGPFDSDPAYEKRMKPILGKMPLIVTRESHSTKYLKSIGIEQNVCQAADPAFTMTPTEFELPANIDSALTAGAIGINLSPLIGNYYSNAENWFDTSVDIIQGIAEKTDQPILLIPHVLTHSNDYLFLEKVANKIFSDNVLLVKPYHATKIKWIISRLQIFVGARTHSTIAALSSCVPTLSIGYSTKANGINYDIFGHTEWVLPSSEATKENVINKTMELNRNKEQIKKYLENMMPEYKNTAFAAGKALRKVINTEN